MKRDPNSMTSRFMDSHHKGDMVDNWLIISEGETRRQGSSTKVRGFVCQCTICNETQKFLSAQELMSGRSTRCRSCATKAQFKRMAPPSYKDGRSHTRLYSIYRSMYTRCTNPKCINYRWYGAKGVKMCEEWANSFEAFRDWSLSHGYADDLQIDRLDADKDYSPDNCVWVTQAENKAHMGRAVLVTYNGKTQNYSQWDREFGFRVGTIASRIRQQGMTFEEAISTPYKPKKK